jgi:hypothetical protein
MKLPYVSQSLLPVLAMALAIAGCAGGRYRTPEAEPTTPRASDVQTSAFGEELVVDGLVEFDDSWRRGPRPRGAGELAIRDGWISWRNGDSAKRNFSIQTDVVKEVRLSCAQQAERKLCLELTIETVTGQSYSFRDPNWAAGEDQRTLGIYEFLRREHPRLLFRERSVKQFS